MCHRFKSSDQKKKKKRIRSVESYQRKKLAKKGHRIPAFQYPIAPGKGTRKLVSFQSIKEITNGGTCRYQDRFGGDLIIHLSNWIAQDDLKEITAFMSNNDNLNVVKFYLDFI